MDNITNSQEKSNTSEDIFKEKINIAYTYYLKSDYSSCFESCNEIITINGQNAFIHGLLGALNFAKRDYKTAEILISKALTLDANCAIAYCNKGNYEVIVLKNYEKGLYYIKKALELDQNFAMTYNALGNYYLYTNNPQLALENFEKALKIFEDYASAYNNIALVYEHDYQDYSKALSYLNKAIEINVDSSPFYSNRSKLYADKLNRIEQGLSDITRAISIDSKNVQNFITRSRFFSDYYNEYNKALADLDSAKALSANSENSMKRYIEVQYQRISGLLSESSHDNMQIKQIMEKIDSSRIERDIRRSRQMFKDFISEKPITIPSDDFEFIVLRRWNSYTPIISGANRVSKGGGYFIKLPNCGVVIDPGYNFIDNFKASGFNFYEIDHVIITHAHNDHTADLESILTLLHQYNKSILGDFDPDNESNTIMQEILNEHKGDVKPEDRNRIEELAKKRLACSTRRKRLRIYLSTSTYKKFSSILDLNSESDYDVILINAGDTLALDYPSKSLRDSIPKTELKITAIHAKHNDLISNQDSLGFVIEYHQFNMVYTGDTGFDKQIEEQYRTIKRKLKHQPIILLAHLGGFQEYEKGFDYSKTNENNQEFFYKNHLGRLGLARLIELLSPSICLISEFGEEFKKSRIDLTGIYQEVYTETFFIPMDIGFSINHLYKTKLIDMVDEHQKTLNYGYYDYNTTQFYERNLDSSLHFYCKGDFDERDLSSVLSHCFYRNLH